MKKNTKIRDNIIILSIVSAVCIFFVAAFRVEPPKTELKVEDSNEGLFQMMPRGQAMEPFFAEQEARDNLDDPTLMSFPNLKYGFSSIRKGEGEPPEPELPVYNLKPLKEESIKIESPPLAGEFKTGDSDPASSFVKPEIDPIEPLKARGRFSKRIVWLEDGREKLSPFKSDEILKLTDNALPESRTELQILKIADSHAFFLRKKCGIPELDNLVLSYYRKKSLKLFVKDENAEQLPKSVTVDWRLLR